MKGVLKRKILKMIGIVFATVFGFTGAVVGVMAAMGKFKTPVVYPTVLEFAVNEQFVILGKEYDPDEDWKTQFEDKDNCPKIESFILSGTNPNFDHEVNRTKCYVWFQNSTSASLITLCDKNGHPLTPNSNGRYLVDCNKPIYYMINKVDENEETGGTVILLARSVNETLKQPDDPMIIYIDRKVESVFVDYGNSNIDEESLTQEIYLGLDMSFDFDYLVNAELALKPISDESAKEIELYYNVEGMNYGTDYIKVTKEEVDKTDSPLHSILTYDEKGVFKFKTSSTTPKTHTFYIAVFPTYEDRNRYEEYIIENPITNFDKLNKTSEDDEIFMTYTTLKVKVEDIEISQAGLLGSKIVLDLYSSDNYIYLDNENKSNNLGLYMKKGEGDNQILDYTRFDEVELKGITDDAWSDEKAKFGPENIVWDNENNEIWKTYTIKTTSLSIGENLKVVDYISKDSITPYYCTNGVAVLDNNGTEDDKSDDNVQLLKTGSYLDFYIYDGTTYVPATFDYDFVESGTGRDKKWNITPKTAQNLNEGESLHIGILVVNNSGEFKFGYYFDEISVSLNELALTYSYKDVNKENVKFTANNRTAEININFEEGNETNINYPTLKLDEIFENISGTYKNFVYVVEESENNFVDTIPNIKYVVGEKTYVVVGYIDEDTKEFVNAIRINSKVSAENKVCELYMLQLKHAYNQNINDMFNKTVLTEGKTFETEEIVGLGSETIIVKGNYILNTSLLSYKYSSDEVYENTQGHELTVESLNSAMLEMVSAFNGDQIEIGVNPEQYTSRIIIKNVEIDEKGALKISFDVGNGLERPNKLEAGLWMALGGVHFDLGKVVILDGSPESVVLRYSDDKVILLHETANDAQNDSNHIKAILSYKEGSFTYTFMVNGESVDEKELFNESISHLDKGFQDGTKGEDGKYINQSQDFNVSYDVKDKNIFDASKISFSESGELILNSGLILKDGETVLQVTIDSTIGYIKIVTDTSEFELTSSADDKNQTDFTHDSKPANLSEFVEFENLPDLTLSVENMVNVKNLECLDYGDGNLQVFAGEADNTWELRKNRDSDPVLTIQDDGSGWKITKSNYYISLKIAFDVETVYNTLKISITFTSSVAISVSEIWEQNRTIYAGTTILLNDEDEENSLFKVERAEGITIGVDFKVKKPIETVLEDAFTLNDDYIGEISIVPIIGGTEVEQEFIFTVKPNVIATVLLNELKSEKNAENAYTLSKIYDLKAYNTDPSVIYGSGEVFYNDNYLVGISEDNLQFKTDSQEDPTLSGGTTLSISPMTAIDEISREIALTYNGIEVRRDVFKITNIHEIIGNEIDLTFKALKEYKSFASVSEFTLYSIKDDAELIEFDVENGYFTITTIVNKKEDVDVTLTFIKGEQTLTYKCVITVVPYTPDAENDVANAYSGATYDLLDGIYDVNSLINDKKIQKLFVTGIKYSPTELAENVASNLVENWVEGGSGYETGVASPACAVIFKELEINRDNLNVYVEFSITYYDEKTTYTYYMPLTISNRQTLTMQYPEEMTLANGNFKFISDYEKDALRLSGLEENTIDGIYTLTNLPYEAVLVYTNTTNSINLNSDEIKKVSRVIATNVEGINTTNSTSTQLTIELIAYQNNGGMADYAERIRELNHTGNIITLPSAQQGMFGTLIFKVSTDSKNYVYYNVYVYCKDSKADANVKTESNLEVMAYNNSYSNLTSSLKQKIVNSNTTYGELVFLINQDQDGVYYSTFKTDYNSNTTKIYLYEVKVTGGTYDGGNLFTEVSEEKIKLDNFFNTITLGLVIDDGVQEYCYGTITIYVQPQQDVVVGGLDYELANGYFKAKVDAGATAIPGPFGSGWTATIVSVDGKTEGFDNIATNDEEDSIVELWDRVPKDTIIIVEYSVYNESSKTYTYAFVTYTYGATSIPTQTSNTVTVGKFEGTETGFDTDIDIKSATETQNGVANKVYFFGTYNNEYEWLLIEGNADNIDLTDKANNTIRFTQTHEEQIFKIKITYTNFDSEDKIRTFTFKVLAGIHFVTASSNGSGLTSTERLSTTKEEVGIYSGVTGSTITINKDETKSSLYYKYYVVGSGLTIYTNSSSKLVLTFDKYNYVLNANEAGVLESDDDIGVSAVETKVNFVHTPVVQPITMTISVQTESDKEFAQRNLYLNVVKTYTTLKSVYLTDGADHENVTSGSIAEDLHKTLLESNNRIVLVDENGNEITHNVDLLKMGFNKQGNPNKINFSVIANATLKTNTGNSDIQFNSVSVNTLCSVFLNNNAGLETNGVVYNYQIMADDKNVDGLDYSSITGYDGTKEENPYLSFLLEDTKSDNAYSNKFVLGTMKDLRNEGVFIVNADDGFTKQTTLVGGYENAIQYLRTEASYNLYLTLNLDTKNVELFVERNGGNIQDHQNNIEMLISIGGVNGEGTIVGNLTIVLSNHMIQELYNPTVDTSIYSGYLINLFEDTDGDGVYDDGKFVENKGIDADDSTLGYQTALDYLLADSVYTINGKEYKILASQTTNDLFVYNENAKTIQTNAVASKAIVTANFLVKDGDYVIKTITYEFEIQLNMKFVVNGDENGALETDFILTNKATADATEGKEFPITKNFIDGSAIDVDKDVKETTKVNYYKVLAYDLYRIKSQDNQLLMDKDSVDVTLQNAKIFENILEVTNSGIVFYQDYSGEIVLKLSVTTKNGIYSDEWTIYVTPILDIELAKSESSILQTDSSAAFNSGTEVDIISNINNRNEEGVGVGVNTDTNFYDYLTYKYGDGNGQDYVTVTYSYKIYEFNAASGISGVTSSKLFNLSADEMLNEQYSKYFIASGGGNGTLNGHSLTTSLPNVPATMDVQSYLVVYKVYLEYLDLTYDENEVEVFYVTYNVINRQKVDSYQYQIDESSALYASDDIDVETRVLEESDKYYLDLFYYQEEITVGGTTYTLKYSNQDISLSFDTTTYQNSSDNDNELIFNSGEFKYNPATRKLSKRNASDPSKYDDLYDDLDVNKENGMNQTQNYKEITATDAYFSVFESNFTNIIEYKNFIDLYLGHKSVLIKDKTFTLVEIKEDSGRYGIDLIENGENLFNNDLTAKLSLVVNDVETVTLENFRLYVDNVSITAKTNDGKGYTIAEMGLGNYFTSNKDITINTQIIGVGTPSDNSWVNNAVAGTPKTDGVSYGTISIPNGTSNNVYNIYKVTYTGETISSSKLYSISEAFFYIGGDNELVVPKYTGVESYLYSVAYNPNANGEVVLNLANAVRVWTMGSGENSGKLINNSDAVSYSSFTVINPTSGIANLTPNYANKTVTLLAKDLCDYKLNNPTAKSYPTITATIKVNSTTLQLVIEFALPTDIISFEVNSNGINDIELTLPFTADDITLNDDDRYSYDSEDKILTINGEKVNEYFVENQEETELIFEITASNGAIFEVVVNKTA